MERYFFKENMNKKSLTIKIFLLCPIPNEQKPIQDYIQLKGLLQTPSTISFLSTLFSFQVINFFFNSLFFTRWKEIEKRFTQPTLFYEEGSWYDGQIWEKPFSLIKNDRLLTTQVIKPNLKRNFILLCFFSFFLLQLVNQ